MDLTTKKPQKICETEDYFPCHQALVQFDKDIIICKKDKKNFIKIFKGKITKEFNLSSGGLMHIIKFDTTSCIICTKNGLFYFDINTEKIIEIETQLPNVVKIFFL